MILRLLLGALVPLQPLARSDEAPPAPLILTVSTSRGDARVPVRTDVASGPVVPAPALVSALGGRLVVDGTWAEVELAHQPFRLLLGAPVYAIGRVVKPLVGAPALRRDTLFLPIQFVTQVLPGELSQRFRYEPSSGRLVELTGRAAAPTAVAASREPDRLPNGLRRGHVVAIDPGHGGVDPGNPGLFFPRGLREKDVTLKVGLLLREELLRRGVAVAMTRTSDTLIKLSHRSLFCRDRCDLFVSIHVNSLKRRIGYQSVRGFETYFFGQSRTEEEALVAEMENDAVRFETNEVDEPTEGLDFILKDLQFNEHLREAARLAELLQSHIAEVHSGPDRGVKQAPYTVLATARRPAVLVELGYSTNRQDATVLTAASSQRNLAGSIADAVVAYLLEYERRVGLSPTATPSGAREE
jgi:N-acetylmuramoyl-L-alanine amidase